jgi:hypothetical protein
VPNCTSAVAGRSRPPGIPAVGFTLVEALVSLLLLALLLQGGWWVLARFRAATREAAARAEGLETVRTLAWILTEELAAEDEGWAWWVAGGDSVVLRSFRGLGLVQPSAPGTADLHVCYRGVRNPEPDKDSVLLLGADGAWRGHGLAERRTLPVPCVGAAPAMLPGSRAEIWRLSPPPRGGVVARVFERGSYHLSDHALRYRRGFGGRQPLTPERILVGRMEVGGGTGLRWEAVLSGEAGDPLPHAWRGVVR